MKKPRNDRRRRELEIKAQAYILGGIRTEGKVDLAACLSDRVLLGALATLEDSGHVQRAGEPDEKFQQPYRLADNEDKRAEFRLARIMADRRDWERRDVYAAWRDSTKAPAFLDSDTGPHLQDG